MPLLHHVIHRLSSNRTFSAVEHALLKGPTNMVFEGKVYCDIVDRCWGNTGLPLLSTVYSSTASGFSTFVPHPST
eukprot:8413554-Pyramimonas_sp.AAC.1